MSLRRQQQGNGRQVLVVGDDAVGVIAVETLDDTAQFAGPDEQTVRRVDDHVDVSTHLSDSQRLELTGNPDTAIVATQVDSLNLLYAQRLRVYFGISNIVARVNDPQYHETFRGLDIATVCAATDVSSSLVDTYSRHVA